MTYDIPCQGLIFLFKSILRNKKVYMKGAHLNPAMPYQSDNIARTIGQITNTTCQRSKGSLFGIKTKS
jgi:hypothetical protein